MSPLQLVVTPADSMTTAFEEEKQEQVRLPQHCSWNSSLLDCGSKLYGRDVEAGILLKAYRNCLEAIGDRRSGSSCVLITGISGLGKTALARSLEPTVRQDGGWFLYGKCDHIQNHQASVNVPYAPFAEAFGRFVEDGVGANQAVRKRLQKAIRQASKDTCVHVLTDAIPALKKVSLVTSGQARQAAGVSNLSSQTRNEADIPTNVVFCKFLQAFCSPESPVVLLLDDLQWLDPSSLSLFKALAMEQTNMPGLLLLGTCRGNEVGFHDPLAEAMRSLEENEVSIQDIQLQDLTPSSVQDLVQDMLHLPANQTQRVTEIVSRQTQGNPFFALQFLRNLNDANILRFDGTKQQWKWELPDEQKSLATFANLDVISLCSLIIDNLIQQYQQQQVAEEDGEDGDSVIERVLMVASCLGTEFSHSQIEAGTVSIKFRESLELTLELLQGKGVLVRRQPDKAGNNAMLQSRDTFYRWSHDRFQQAAYSLIPSDHRIDFHVSVGLNLLRQMSLLELQNHPFVVVHQFCHEPPSEAATLPFQSNTERAQLGALCLAAGERSALSSAFNTAAIYFKLGRDVIGSPDQAFATQYVLSLRLFNAAAEMEFCLGDFERVDQLAFTIVEHARSFEDTLRAHETQIYSLGARQDLESCIRLGLQVLRQLGEPFPRKAGTLSVLSQVFKTKIRLAKVTADDVMTLKPLRDWKKAAALRIMNMMGPHATRSNINLAVLLATRGIQITLQHGLSEMACFGFFSFGYTLCNHLGYVNEGIRIVQIADLIQQKWEAKSLKCRIQLIVWAYCKAWKVPIKESIQPLQDASQSGFLSGDIEMACLCLYCASCASFFSGSPLAMMQEELSALHEQFSVRHVETIFLYLRINQQLVQNLKGRSKNHMVLCGDFLNKSTGMKQATDAGDVSGVALIHMFNCFLAVYFNDVTLAKSASQELKKSSPQAFNVPLIYQWYFVGGLAEVLAAKGNRKKVRRAGKLALKSLKKYARYCPENVMNKIYLIEAEQSAALGLRGVAIAKYHQSIEQAKQQHFVQEEALACERAGMAMIAWGDDTLGTPLLESARDLYESWGSPVKVQQVSALLSDFTQS